MKILLSISICIAAIVYTQRNAILSYIPVKFLDSKLATISTLRQTITVTTMSSTTPKSTFVGLQVIPPNDPSLNAKKPKSRGIKKFFEAVDTPEGAGARVRRSIGTRELKNFTPFLMVSNTSIFHKHQTKTLDNPRSARSLYRLSRCRLPRPPSSWTRDNHLPSLGSCRSRGLRG